MAVLSRAVFFPREGSSAPSDSVLVLDLERHLSLVTPVGASLDGALGLRGPRRQELWALYSVCNGQIDGIWLTPAAPSPPSQPAGSSNGSGGSSTSLAGEAAFNALRSTPREWPALEAVIEKKLGAGFSTLTGPLHTARIGRYEMQGRRPTMEDQLAVEKLIAPHIARPAMGEVQFMGLYDGHGGAACANYVASKLHSCLERTTAFTNGEMNDALVEAFATCERGFLDESESASGSCAVVAVLGGGRLHIAHIGDSRAVLCAGEDGEAVPLTEDHKPDSVEERARIEMVGGMVVIGGRCARVTHPGTSMMLATSRSFGDRNFKDSWHTIALQIDAAVDAQNEAAKEEAAARESAPSGEEAEEGAASDGKAPVYRSLSAPSPPERSISIATYTDKYERDEETGRSVHAFGVKPLLSPVPCVVERTLKASDKFVILACDGVWDVLSDQQACDSVKAALELPHGTPEEAARKLVGDAYNAGSEDNISVLVAVLGQELL